MPGKIRLLLTELREKGLFYFLKRITSFLFRPMTNLMQQNTLIVELRYGVLPKLKFSASPGLVKLAQTDLVREIRKFWYSNVPGQFDLDGEKISRKEIFTYGGPNPKFICPACQKAEWLSRVRQKNLFTPHTCDQSEECAGLCQKQGDELWAHLHQNFDFSLGCDSSLPTPRCLYVIHREKRNFLNPRCDILALILRRQFAFSCQIDVADTTDNINWSNYDFLFVVNDGNIRKFYRPNLPVIMYGHDPWPVEDKRLQWAIDWLKPDIFLTPVPYYWKKNFRIPNRTKIVFYPLFDSLFFARPNLNKKEIDLLVTGAVTSASIYQPRILLNKQLSQFPSDYKIEFSHSAGSDNVFREGAVVKKDVRSESAIRFLNKWSEYLGRARYVIFGNLKYPCATMKHYETLGSGAVAILPEAPDLKHLEVRPFEHYIPLSEIEGNNQKLAYYLDHYQDFRYIAENAVNWYKDNSDKMLFDDFESTISEVTKHKYPKRLI